MDALTAVAAAARRAGQVLAGTTLPQRNAVLAAIAAGLTSAAADVAAANDADLAAATDLPSATKKRLVLNGDKVADLTAGIGALIALPDPLGVPTMHRELADGLQLRRITCPIGVLCIIFESRPEAVVQISTLAVKAGNAVILKGGKEAAHSNAALVAVIRAALTACHLPPDAVQLVSTREDIAALLRLDAYIDLVIPRGSNKLVREIKAATRIPVMGHADGICSVYIDVGADEEKAVTLAVDSKTNYPAACNAAETLLLHRAVVGTVWPRVAAALLRAGVTLHCDPEALPGGQAAAAAVVGGAGASGETCGAVVPANPAVDWTMEWLGLDMSVAVVADVHAAAAWVNQHGSHHTDVVVTEDEEVVEVFARHVDSAGVFHNASSRFADGFRYGFGAEVGISTNRIHARGPVGLEGLVTYKYLLEGHGHCVGQFVPAAGGGIAPAVTIGGIALPHLMYTHRPLPLMAPAPPAAAAMASLLSRPRVWLDGGFATELERRGHALTSALWSASVLVSQPGEVRAVHDGFLAAGCDIIGTGSYQVSRPGFEHEGMAGWQDALRSAIDIAHEAVVAAWSARREGQPAAVAISQGPLGAVWHDGSEFTGTYGLPTHEPVVPITAELKPGRQTLESLKAFHRERLLVVSTHLASKYASTHHPMLVAFETVPCLLEVKAIAQLLAAEFPHLRAWISVAAASGDALVSGEALGDVTTIVDAAAPDQVIAVGVNCCHPAITRAAVVTLGKAGTHAAGRRVIAYPNRGEVWNPATMGWDARPWAGGAGDCDGVRGRGAPETAMARPRMTNGWRWRPRGQRRVRGALGGAAAPHRTCCAGCGSPWTASDSPPQSTWV